MFPDGPGLRAGPGLVLGSVLAAWWTGYCLQLLRSWHRSRKTTSPWRFCHARHLSPRARRIFEQCREERIRTVILPGLQALVPVVLMVRLFLPQPWRPHGIKMDLRFGLTGEGLLLCGGVILAYHLPRQATLQRMDFFLLILALAAGIHTTFLLSADFSTFLILAAGFRVIMAMAYSNPLVQGLMEFCLVGLQLLWTSCTWARDDQRPALIVVLGMTVHLVGVFSCNWQIAEVSQSHAAAESLLTVLCDAVVQLYSDLSLVVPSPKLDAILLRSSCKTSAEANFSLYLQEGDRARFQEFLQADSLRGSARSIRVNLAGAYDTKVAAQIYHTSLLDASGQLIHILGVQEDQEKFSPPAAVVTTTAPILIGAAFEESDDIRSPSWSHSSVSDEETMERTLSSSSSSRRAHVGTLESWGTDGDDVHCRVELSMKIQLKLLEETPKCSALFGFSQQPSALLDRFHCGEAILDWLRIEFTALAAEPKCNGLLPFATKFGHVKVRNPTPGVSHSAILRATFESVSCPDLFSWRSKVRLNLSPPKPHRRAVSGAGMRISRERLPSKAPRESERPLYASI